MIKMVANESLDEKLKDMNPPKVGDIIYVPSAFFLSHGLDDFCGGKVHVIEIKIGVSGGKQTYMARVKERPSCLYNWEFLCKEQSKLKERYNNKWAHLDPDYREEFNVW